MELTGKTIGEIEIPIDSVYLKGLLTIPDQARNIIIFVHGSGSSRLSPRNQSVAEFLQNAGFATLLFDLLTEKEDREYENRFDIKLLTRRLEAVTEWAKSQPNIKNLSVGYFGASTGSAAAINAAADLKNEIKAIVSRGGRPDLSLTEALESVSAPILLIVGGEDDDVLQLHSRILPLIRTKNKMEIIPGATHLFEEPGALEKVSEIAAEWFKEYMRN